METTGSCRTLYNGFPPQKIVTDPPEDTAVYVDIQVSAAISSLESVSGETAAPISAASFDLQHLRQLRTLRTAWIIHVVCNLLRALGCKFIEPIKELGIAAHAWRPGVSSFLGRGGTADLSPRINLFLWLVWYRL